jgi:hypothetical protein
VNNTRDNSASIVKFPKSFDVDAHILAYWLLFCRAPKRAEPDADGMYDLSEIGAAPEKNWTKATPYSLAQVWHEAFPCK